MAARTPERRSVVITGGNGVLGQRLATHLLELGWQLVLLDDFEGFHKGKRRDPRPEGADPPGSFEHLQGDVSSWGPWTEAFKGVDAVIHFAACNPYPEASWEESRISVRMSANVVAAAQRAGVRRLVVASSSHVLGGYMQEGPCVSEAAPALHPETKLGHFTRFRLPGLETDASPYASAKVAVEEMARAATFATPSLSVVIVRIGWCQPGDNRPQRMSATATHTVPGSVLSDGAESEEPGSGHGFDDPALILSWLHRIWLSTRDFHCLFRRAVETELEGCLTVFGISRNGGMRWSCDSQWSRLGFEPADDALRELQESQSQQQAEEENGAEQKRRRLA